MATRSFISIKHKDNTYSGVYCHWDGYLSHNGAILQEHYLDPFKLQKLIDNGDVSSLRPEVNPEPYREHTFDNAQEDVCVFYMRDRGEEGVEARYFKDFSDYEKNHECQEFEYILRTNGVWYVSQYGGEYLALANELVKEETVGYGAY